MRPVQGYEPATTQYLTAVLVNQDGEVSVEDLSGEELAIASGEVLRLHNDISDRFHYVHP